MVIDTLQLDIIVNNKGTTARINSTTNALKNLHKVISDINGAGGVNGAINGGGGSGSSSRGGSSRSSGSKSASSLMKNLNFGSMVAKLYFVRNITKQLGRDLAKVVQYGIDYEETLNLWQVAMKGNTAEARKFITEMNRAYGISEITLMNYQATFKNMLSSLGGINQEVAYGLSETLSQMALDYASLYNTSIESAMTKFQAVLAGQVRPIRSESGYDITQATLYEVYKDIGGTKSVRQLSETEKRLLRILAVYRQMKDTAVGDYAKTITSTANQTRFMSETIKDIATWIGVGANQWLQQSNLLIRINAYLVALKELAKSFAISMGYVEESEEKANDPLADLEENWNGINEQVDEYKGKLLDFDKFQVLSSAEVGGDVDISAELLKAMQEYEAILDKANNVALFGDAEKNIKGAYDILKEWGYEYDEQSQQWLKDGKTVKENIENIIKALNGCKEAVYLVVGALLAWKAINFIEGTIIPLISKLQTLTKNFKYAQVAAAGMAMYGFMVAANAAKNLFTSWDDMSGLEKAIEIFKLLAGAAMVAAVAIGVFHTSWSVGVAAGVITAGIALLMGYMASIKSQTNEIGQFANGGLATKGSLFYAGEAGPELVTQTSGGGSTIMNMKQLEDAVARGFIRGFAATDDGTENNDTTEVYVDGQRLFNIMRNTAKRNGYDFVRV